MRDSHTVVFEKEPFSWILYNKLATLSESHSARSHGVYFDSFTKAFDILYESSEHAKCGLSLIVFSDGKPSDISLNPYSGFPANLYQLIDDNCSYFGNRFTFVVSGFGRKVDEFSLMESLISRAKTFGVKEASFTRGSLDTTAFRTALSSAVSSLTETRTLLSRLDNKRIGDFKRERAEVEKEKAGDDTFGTENWNIYDPRSNRSCSVRRLTREYKQSKSTKFYNLEDVEQAFLGSKKHDITGFAVCKTFFGEGAERIVHKMTETSNGRKAGDPLVAKSSKYKNEKGGKFHYPFIACSIQAIKWAEKFNKRLDDLHVSTSIPRISFLPCSIYICEEAGKKEVYLAEKQLDIHSYRKWNNNAGGVDGIAREKPVLDPGLLYFEGLKLDAIDEGEEGEDDDYEKGDELISTASTKRLVINSLAIAETNRLQKKILDEDIPQAFSHFTHSYSKRSILVCDIQGNLVEGEVPIYELTDPCVHTSLFKVILFFIYFSFYIYVRLYL